MTPVNGPGRTLEVFEETGALLKGHFRLTSGLHSNRYMQSALVLEHPSRAQRLGSDLAGHFQDVDLVVSPAIGGLIIGYEVARALDCRFLFTERGPDGKMSLRRGFAIRPGERALVIEDVITTGGSTREVIEILRSLGAEVIGAGSIVDRSGGRADLGVPRVSLATIEAAAWTPEECPLCKDGSPVIKPGSRPTA